ncbi:RNA polymerase sigma factor [Amycolatopsis sp. CA-230715]|uniref:RNA polymerase sigma factor n=1 Tax=Amycolatopsis sp. CA-230715 TaxID=2745196 RepID=UPI001C02D7E9|nr:sigma-70 family RNA polymerase sigma factor [Amycolatopsis sp. CA-230715]QWF82441.1 hypothetical protein HUW46_05878 [Amycolatopsis sp. CA-230715]
MNTTVLPQNQLGEERPGMTFDDQAAGHDDALSALIGALLRDFAAAPGRFAVPAPRGGITRVSGSTTAPDGGARFTGMLVELFDGSREAFTSYAREHLSDNRAEAEDVVQTAFMRVFARKPEITEPESLRAYVWTSVKNATNDAMRRMIVTRERVEGDGDDKIAVLRERAGLAVDELVLLRQYLLRLLDALQPRERETVVLHGFGGYTYKETAKIMGITEGAAKKNVHTAVKRIEAFLKTAP